MYVCIYVYMRVRIEIAGDESWRNFALHFFFYTASGVFLQCIHTNMKSLV